ncbi:helix-turn-helix domain-containing protein [Parapedobacter soli]|uniref:helix-turn-helix domain-containing protein n=1 Tax=Parapedobacter soli TaxID=416955 RepID=UPI0021CAAA0F|nr:helix-turn-helix domain-containing protein [Parapedobacter soli]
MENVFLTSLTTPEIRQLFREEIETFFKGLENKSEKSARPPATRKEAANHLGISLPTLDTLVKTGQLKSFNIGRQVRIDWGELESFIKKRGAA